MRKNRKKILLTEFVVEIYTDGTVRWNGLDRFIAWKLGLKPTEGFLPYASKIQKFGMCAKSR